MAALLASAFFAAVSGSAPATVVAVGSVMIVGMVQSGYTRKFAAGVICNAGTLGILIPPSLVMVVYGAITESSIGRLFIAGILPGNYFDRCNDDYSRRNCPKAKHAAPATREFQDCCQDVS